MEERKKWLKNFSKLRKHLSDKKISDDEVNNSLDDIFDSMSHMIGRLNI